MFAPTLQGLTEPQARLLLLFASIIVNYVPEDFQTLRDEDIAEAAGTLAATLETASHGVIYEHRAGTSSARRLADDLKRLLAELRGETPGPVPATGAERIPASALAQLERDSRVALRRIERGARDAMQPSAVSRTVYRDLLTRLLQTAAGEAAGTSTARPSALILP